MADRCQVKRIGFTVHGRLAGGGETRWDADRLEHAWLADKDQNLVPALSFICSGHRVTLPASDVISVEFHKPGTIEHDGKKYWTGISHCAACDGPITFTVPSPT